MIVLDASSRLSSHCSWHADMKLNERQAALLAADLHATRERLVREALTSHLGRIPTPKEAARHLRERPEPGSPLIWVCWGDKAIAVRTNPTAHVRDCLYFLTWHWKTLPNDN